MPIEELKKITANIDGFLVENEGVILFELAKKCKGNGAIVEIGSWKGKSTIWIAQGSKEGCGQKIYAIDHFVGSSENQEENKSIWTFEEFKKNIKIAHVDDFVIPIVKTSENAAKDFDKPIEFIFIDGAHEYEAVKLDFDIWFPKVINGGIIALHDSVADYAPGPKKVAEDMIYKSRYFKNIRTVECITYAEKTAQNSLLEQLDNRSRLFFINFYHFASKFNLPKPLKIIGKKIMPH